MLIGRVAKRDKKAQFAVDARLDIVEDGETIGGVVYAVRAEMATIALGGESWRAARARPRRDEALWRAAIRLATGGEKPPPNPILLTDASGRTWGRRWKQESRLRSGWTRNGLSFAAAPAFHPASVSIAKDA